MSIESVFILLDLVGSGNFEKIKNLAHKLQISLLNNEECNKKAFEHVFTVEIKKDARKVL